MVQKSTLTPADGVKIQIVPASRVPALFVENLSPEPVIVLGKDDEPFARIGPKITEVNAKSPTWAEVQQARGRNPSDEADATAEPKWEQVADAPRWTLARVPGGGAADGPAAADHREGPRHHGADLVDPLSHRGPARDRRGDHRVRPHRRPAGAGHRPAGVR